MTIGLPYSSGFGLPKTYNKMKTDRTTSVQFQGTSNELQGLNVFHVDDDQGWRSLVSDDLNEKGVKVDQASSSAEAKQKLLTNDYDFYLFDMNIDRGETGLELANELMQNKFIDPTRIRFLTSTPVDHYRLQGHEIPIINKKSYNQKSLVETIVNSRIQ